MSTAGFMYLHKRTVLFGGVYSVHLKGAAAELASLPH